MTVLVLLALGISSLSSCPGPDEPAPEPGAGQAQEVDQTPPKEPVLVEQDEAKLGDAFRLLGNGDHSGCREVALLVLKDNPAPKTRARAEFFLALGFHKDKQYADALPHFEQAQRGPDFSGKNALPYFLGWCHYWLGDFDEAELSFRLHLEGTKEGDSHFALGIIALERGLGSAAESELNLALGLFEAKAATGDASTHGDIAKTHARLADLRLDADDYAGANEHLSIAVELDANRAAVWWKLYQVSLELEDVALAAKAHSEYKRCKELQAAASGMSTEAGS